MYKGWKRVPSFQNRKGLNFGRTFPEALQALCRSPELQHGDIWRPASSDVNSAQVPPSDEPCGKRINLTFRWIKVKDGLARLSRAFDAVDFRIVRVSIQAHAVDADVQAAE